jgi:hypothetical protein
VVLIGWYSHMLFEILKICYNLFSNVCAIESAQFRKGGDKIPIKIEVR